MEEGVLSMPRKAREKAECSIYHISVRGNNKQNIFLDEQDRIEYLARLRRYKETYNVGIYAYCLMTNHVHLLVFDNGQDISRFMQGLNLSYAIYFNKKHGRSGHLFQERFTSKIVDNEGYLAYVSKYIHLNPVRAQLVEKAEDYRWSSYCAYIENNNESIVECDFLLSHFGNKEAKSRKAYKCYMEEKELIEKELVDEVASTEEEKTNEICLRGMIKVEHDELIRQLSHYWGMSIEDIMCKKELGYKREMLIYLVSLMERLTHRQISQLLNVNDVYVAISIRKIVEMMIKDKKIMQERDAIINLLEN